MKKREIYFWAAILALFLGAFGVFVYHNIAMANQGLQAQIVQLQQQASTTRATSKRLAQAQDALSKEQADISQIKIQASAVDSSVSTPSLESIVQTWSPAVALVECEFYSTGISMQGSGTLVMWNSGRVGLLTNRHVIEDSNWTYRANSCGFGFSQDYQTNIYTATQDDEFGGWSNSVDAAVIYPSANPALQTEPMIGNGDRKFCSDKAQVGDEVLIIGYPAIGSNNGATVTEGIISGIETTGDYVTSAKIDHGNSGGAAISVSGDCYLGIPTSSDVGSIESLGRILMWQDMLN